MEIVYCVNSVYQVREIRDMLFLSTICTHKYLLPLFSRSKYIFLNEYDLLAGILFSTSVPRVYYPYFPFLTWKISSSCFISFCALPGFFCQNSRPCSVSSLSTADAIPSAPRGTNWWVLEVLRLVKQSFVFLMLFNQESKLTKKTKMDRAVCSHQGPFSLPGSGTKAAQVTSSRMHEAMLCCPVSSRMQPVYQVRRQIQAQGCSRRVCSWAGLCWAWGVTRWQTHDGQGL